jgi:ABC-2 type transport system permease protein
MSGWWPTEPDRAGRAQGPTRAATGRWNPAVRGRQAAGRTRGWLRLGRVMVRTCLFQVRMRALHPVMFTQAVYQPLIFGLSAFALFASGAQPGRLAYALVGGGLVGLWSVTLFHAAFDLQFERYSGTLELLIASPPPFAVTVAGKTLCSLVIGLVPASMFTGAGLVFFHQAFAGVQYPQLAISACLTLLAFFALGMTIAGMFTVSRAPGGLANGLEMPALILCGFLFPPSRLPFLAQALSWALPPTWAVRGLYQSIGRADGPHVDIRLCWLLSLVLSAIYLALATVIYAQIEARTREGGQLALL